MKPKTKHILIALAIILVAVFLNKCHAQSQINLSAGYKAIEVGYNYTDEETELIYGVSISGVSTDVAEHRANVNDKGKIHEFNGKVVPALFANIGAKFDRLNLIGKIGGAYVSQSINKEATKDLFLALGLIVEYEISDCVGLRASYDSVNSALIGVSFKL